MLTCRSRARSRPGWISHARWTTASAPRKSGTRSDAAMSARANSTLGTARRGARRASPSTDSTRSSPASAPSRLVPTLPVAPTTTTRTRLGLPESGGSKRPRPARCEHRSDEDQHEADAHAGSESLAEDRHAEHGGHGGVHVGDDGRADGTDLL